jgi:DNA-binding MarR family transcriptional regulator
MSPARIVDDAIRTGATSHGRPDRHAPRAGTKQALLVSMLKREGGASIRELIGSLGWKPNTVHAALSTLRTSGWQISVGEDNRERRYLISAD